MTRTSDVALVTGGASGLGRAAAVELAERGYHVAVADRDTLAAQRVAAEMGGDGAAATAVRMDVTDYSSVLQAVDAAQRLGRLRVAVNNAGVAGVGAATADYPIEAWGQLMRVNLDGVFHCIRAELPVMVAAGGGSIINMASVLGMVGRANSSAYVAAKHAVIGLTKSAALEYASLGVRVNAVAPGFVLTPLNEARLDESARAGLAESHAIGRLGTAEEVAKVVAFLAGPESSFVTGSCQVVDGGYSAH